MYCRVQRVLPWLAEASRDLADAQLLDTSRLSGFMDRMLTGRISRRLVVEHHLASHDRIHKVRPLSMSPTKVICQFLYYAQTPTHISILFLLCMAHGPG